MVGKINEEFHFRYVNFEMPLRHPYPELDLSHKIGGSSARLRWLRLGEWWVLLGEGSHKTGPGAVPGSGRA